MKKLLLSAMLTFSAIASAQAAHPMCGETELSDVMGEMKHNMKAIKNSFKKGDIEGMNFAAKTLLAQVRKGDTLIPLAISDNKELDEKQKAEFEKYQRGMAELEKAVMELIKAQDDKARKAALGKIGKSAKQGHKAFKMDCDE